MASGTGPQVVIIPFENTNYSSGVAAPAGQNATTYYPTFHSAAQNYYDQNGGSSKYWALEHPSLPNYLQFTSGGDQAKLGTDNMSPPFNVNNIFRQVIGAGLTWKVYGEDSKFHTLKFCHAGQQVYSAHHDPANMYTDTSGSANHVDFDSLVTDINANNVSADYVWIVPNIEDDGHDSNYSSGICFNMAYPSGVPGHDVMDAWLRGDNPMNYPASRAFPGLTKLRAAMRPNGIVILWFDESAGNSGGYLPADDQVFNVCIAPQFQGKAMVAAPGGRAWNHSDLLLGIQNLFNTAYPGKFPKWTTTGGTGQLQSTYLNGAAIDLGGGAPVLSKPAYVSGADVSGSLVEPGTLTANPGTWNGNPAPTFTYLFQWATSATATTWTSIGTDSSTSTYNTTSTDLTRFIRCQVTGHNSQGTGGPISTAAVGPVTAASSGVPVNTSLPQITGLAQVDSTLTTSTGAWNPSGTPAYQWQRQPSGGSFGNILGATGQTYLLVSADQNAMIRVQVTETNGSGPSLPATALAVGPIGASPNTAPRNTSLPTISGTVQQGQTLTANAGTWTGTPTPTVSGYQWQSSATATGTFTNLALGTSSTFLIPNDSSLVGLFIRVQVTESNTFGGVTHPTTANSLAVGPVQAVVVGQAPQNQTPPQISGTLQVNSTLTEFGDTWTGTTPMTPAYQWQRQASGTTTWVNIGTNSSTYPLVQADAAALIRVTVTETNSVSSTPATSLPVGPIAGDTTPPTIPTGLHTTSITTTEVDLAWTASTDTGGSGMKGYVLKRGLTLITIANVTSYRDTGVAAGTTYLYSIAAVDQNGNQSAFSPQISVTTPSVVDVTAPNVPTGLAGASPAGVGSEIDVHWNAASDNPGGSGIAGYRVTRIGAASTLPFATSPPVAPSVTGSPTTVQTLSETHASWTNGPVLSYRYQWQGDGGIGAWLDIPAATGATYQPASSDVGSNVRVLEWATNATGESLTPQASPGIGPVIAAPVPDAITPPSITGSPVVGQTLTEVNATWTNTPILSRRYQWQSDATGVMQDVSGSTAQTYVVRSADSGHNVRVKEWATNSVGESNPPQTSQTVAVA